MCERSFHNRATQILRMTGVGVDIRVESLYLPIIVDGDLPTRQEGVPLTGRGDILIAIEHAPHWTTSLVCGDRNNGSELNRASLFAAEAAAHALDFADNLVGCNSCDGCYIALSSWMCQLGQWEIWRIYPILTFR